MARNNYNDMEDSRNCRNMDNSQNKSQNNNQNSSRNSQNNTSRNSQNNTSRNNSPVFRRSTRKIPTFCFLESQKSNFTQPENPLFSTKFQCPIWAFFIEKIYFLWYNNSTS